MCGRFSLIASADQLRERFGVKFPDIRPNYNAAPTQNLPIIIDNEVVLARWGFVPSWADTPKYTTINARADTIETSKMFKNAFEKRRCLVPADGFYEWNKHKVPYRITLKDQPIFAFAGIYKVWNDTPTFTIITTSANELMSTIHDRMPVILQKEKEKIWISESLKSVGARELLTSYNTKNMEKFQVSNAVNSTRNNSPDLIKKAATLVNF